MSNIDSTGENLWHTGFHEGLLEVFHLGEDEEIVVNVQFLFFVEQSKGVLNSNRDRTEAVETTKWALNGVLNEGLTSRTKFHQDVIGTFLDSHDFRNTISNFQNLG